MSPFRAPRRPSYPVVLGTFACLAGALLLPPLGRAETKLPATREEWLYRTMSPMGARAAGIHRPADPDAHPRADTGFRARPMSVMVVGGADVSVVPQPAVGTQSETTIASNATGSILIAGFNDSRGFPDPSNPDQVTLSLSGLGRSIDNGASWQAVPVGPGGASTLPTVTNASVFGDPDVKYDPTRDVFVYSSIYVRPSDNKQGVCVSVSNSGATAGTSWSAPREVTPSFINNESGDKPFIDINRQTGRILCTWTSFGITSTKIDRAYSDDAGMTWSTVTTLVSGSLTAFLQASEPRFLPGATNATSTAYVVWSNGTSTTRNVGMARSTDGGATFSAGVSIDASSFSDPDQILGVDRVNTSPSMAIDYTSGRVYVVYQRDNSQGTGDVALRSLLGAPAAGTPVILDSNPGSDRAQFMPAVAVDQSSGRVHVIWYDQDPRPSGDLTELMHTFSTDGGATWSRPAPLFDRPFHAGIGNDTGEPNMGDYLQCIAQGGALSSLAAATNELTQFDEGLPARSLYSPDPYYDRLLDGTSVASLRLGTVSFLEPCASGANGFLDPGETGNFTFPLENYVNNAAVSPVTFTNVSATLSSTTPGVTIAGATQSYGSIAPLATVSNAAPFQVKLDGSFTAGTYAHLVLDVTSDQGAIELTYLLTTGSPVTTSVLLSENFEGVTPPALPAGWSAQVGLPSTSTDQWVTTSSGPPGTSTKMAFHGEGTSSEWMRLWSPVINVPGTGPQTYVTLDFDVAYNTEFDAAKAIQAFDGLFLRVTDVTGVTPATALRSVLAEAFAERFTTAGFEGYPRHFPDSNDAIYFSDMSAWAGSSGGWQHVSMKFPGAGMVGRSIQLRFEYTQDASASCGSGTCGVAIDNVVLKSIVPGTQFVAAPTSTAVSSNNNPAPAAQPVTFIATTTPSTATGSVEFFDGTTSLGTAPVSGGSAQLMTTALTEGSHSITGVYSGDACDLGSTSPPLTQQTTSPVGVSNPLPREYAIERVVPNPAAHATTVTFALPRSGAVALGIYDLHGRLVRQLVKGHYEAGTHTLTWDLRKGDGRAAGAGVYFVRMAAADVSRSARFAIVR